MKKGRDMLVDGDIEKGHRGRKRWVGDRCSSSIRARRGGAPQHPRPAPRPHPTSLRRRPASAAPRCGRTPLRPRPTASLTRCRSAPLRPRPAASPPRCRSAPLRPRPATAAPRCGSAPRGPRHASAAPSCGRAQMRSWESVFASCSRGPAETSRSARGNRRLGPSEGFGAFGSRSGTCAISYRRPSCCSYQVHQERASVPVH